MASADKAATAPAADQAHDDRSKARADRDGKAKAQRGPGDETRASTDDEKAVPAPPSREELEKELDTQRRLLEEQREAVLRVQAEMENLRKRSARELEKAHKYALEGFMGELLPVKDSMELGISAASEEGTDVAHVREGLVMTLKMFEQAVRKFGLVEVDPLGEEFNPDFHQAITMQESADATSGTVIAVVQKGYLLNERLVRPAMVVVAK